MKAALVLPCSPGHLGRRFSRFFQLHGPPRLAFRRLRFVRCLPSNLHERARIFTFLPNSGSFQFFSNRYRNCAAMAVGQLFCSGDDEDRQCNVPEHSGPALEVAAGYAHTCAVRGDVELVCFGRNDYGQCDVPVDLGPVVAVDAGGLPTCAARHVGELV